MQLESRKAQAVRFTRDVLGDDDRADEIEGESLDDYAGRKQIRLPEPERNKASVGDVGRGARIRTGDLLRPRQARYQAAPRPDRGSHEWLVVLVVSC
jgi:hypothetical protein